MAASQLKIDTQPELRNGRMILAFSGWMDGGNVSTGTVEWLADTLKARRVAQIEPADFYLYSFPGSMEMAALFRPHTEIQDGIIAAYEPPENAFHYDKRSRLILFCGREPNFAWHDFAECIFSFAAKSGVSELYFVGSVGGTVPHTREPRMFGTVSHENLKPLLQQYGIALTSYKGPASFSTYLLTRAHRRGLAMAALVAEIPAYIQGTNPKSIEAMVRKLAALLGLQVDLGKLPALSTAWEERLTTALQEKPELATYIQKLEEDYDNEVFDTQMGDLKDWLQQQGIRVD